MDAETRAGFERVDKHFDELFRRFDGLISHIEVMEHGNLQRHGELTTRFEALESRFEALESRFDAGGCDREKKQ